MCRKRGFTLIELLVVVLIIGVLSSAAIPMYTKAVEKSRAVKMLASARSLYNAQQRYYMANGAFANSFEELDINFGTPMSYENSNMKNCTYGASFSAASSDAMRDAGDYEIAIGGIYSNRYAVAYHKKRCAAVFFALSFEGKKWESDEAYCSTKEYIWGKQDWCHTTLGTNPNRYVPGLGGSLYALKIPSF